MGNYKVFNIQEENTYYYEEMKQQFNKRDLDNMMEDKKKEYLRDVNLKYQERVNKMEQAKKKALAIALSVSVAVGAIGIGYVDKVMKEKVPSLDTDTIELSYSYDDFIDYCNYLNSNGIKFEPSQDNYRQVIASGELTQFINERDNGGKRL